METPEYFVDRLTHWHDWARTEIDLHENGIHVGTLPFGSIFYTEAEVEANYPGFFPALKSLSSIGCDRSFVTHILKFCILRAGDMDLAAFLVKSETLSKVESALAIGLSGEELTKLMMGDSQVSVVTDLPDDFLYVSRP